jgi:hypothetical protein
MQISPCQEKLLRRNSIRGGAQKQPLNQGVERRVSGHFD